MTHTARMLTWIAVVLVLSVSLSSVAIAQTDLPEPDVIKLNDGRELNGTIIKEQSGYIWLDMGDGQPHFLSPDKIKEVVRNTPSAAESKKNPLAAEYIVEPWERVDGVTRAAVITAEGIVGMQMSARPLREAIPMLHEEGVDLVVLKISSGGGYLPEIQRLSDVLHNEYKQEFEIIGWIDAAISAAAMAAMTIEDIYFMPHDNFGAVTGIHSTASLNGDELEAAYYQIEKLCARGGKEYGIINAMRHIMQLSYDVDPVTGEVVFYYNLTGKHILSDGESVLVLDASEAEHCGFSAGTAGTLDELTALLEPQIGKIQWVGKDVEGIAYPVCKAELHQMAYRDSIDYQDKRFQEVVVKCQMELGNAQGVEVEKRSGYLRRAEQYLSSIKETIKINPNFGIFTITDEWIQKQEQLIRELRSE